MKYYFIAGEKSGDVHGGNLIAQLRVFDSQVECRGFGGDRMRAEGMRLTVHHRDMDFAGLVGLLGHLRAIYARLRQCREDILAYRPDVVILIDYGGFNLRMAHFCKAHAIKVFYYIPPKVWAWGQSRVHQLKTNVDRIFSILPFEQAFYQSFGIEVTYVGNPVLDAVRAFEPNSNFLMQSGLDFRRPVAALLPGSRKSELRKIVPLFAQLVARHPQFQFAVAAVSTIPSELYAPLKQYANVTMVMDATYDLLRCARAAVVTSGTATLETALLNAPQVTLYKATALEYFVASFLIRVKYVSLVNLIADAPVIKEFMQRQATVENLTEELRMLMEDEAYRQAMQKRYRQIRDTIDVGSASENAAAAMVTRLRMARPPSAC